jgi:phospholipase/carboxylesterase
MKYLPAVEKVLNPQQPTNAAVIWLHGLGADGHDFAAIVPELNLPASLGLRFVFPHAPPIPVTINNGMVMPAWYDILELNLGRRVDEGQLRQSAQAVHALVRREIARGVPASRIVLAGFSQGGAVVYEAGLSFDLPLAGILSLSSYFATADSVQVADANRTTPIRICHGTLDPMVPQSMGKRSAEALTAMGCSVEYSTYTMAHAVCAEEIADISLWLRRVLADQ